MIAVAVMLGIVFCMASLHAEPSRLSKILHDKVIRVGTTGDYRPFSYLNEENGSFEGLDIDMANILARNLDVEVRFVKTSWPRLMQDLLEEKFDVAMSGISVTPDRQKSFFFSMPYMETGKTPIARCTRAMDFQTLEQIDRADVRIIVNPGGTNAQFLKENIRNAAITVFDNNTLIFGEIVEGNADLMITDAVEARLQEKLNPTLCALHPDNPFNFSEKAYLLPQDIDWKAWIDHWLQQEIESGAYAKIYRIWLGKDDRAIPRGGLTGWKGAAEQ